MTWTARLAVVGALLAFAAPASATTITVNTQNDTLADEGACSLREAVRSANTNAISGGQIGECPAGSSSAPDAIVLPAGDYIIDVSTAEDDDAADGDLDIKGDLTITGVGNTSVVESNTARVFDVISGTVAFSNFQINGGFAPDGTAAGAAGQNGGCIRNVSTLSLSYMNVNGCFAGAGADGANGPTVGGAGGSGGSGGAIYTTGDVTIDHTDFRVNNANGGGYGGSATPGGASFGGAGGGGGSGGAIYNSGATLTISDSLFSQNYAGSGGPSGSGDFPGLAGAGGGGGAIASTGPVSITRTTFTKNESGLGAYSGGGTFPSTASPGGDGGALAQIGSTLTVADSSFSLNKTLKGGDAGGINGIPGAGGSGGALAAAQLANVQIARTTFTGNTTAVGGNGAGGTAGAGGGAGGAIAIVSGGQTTVALTASTVSGNSTGAGGTGSTPGARGPGGGVAASTGFFTSTNSTIAGNSGGLGSAVYHGAAFQTTIVHTTIAGNSGGAQVYAAQAGVTLTNSIVKSDPGVASCAATSDPIADGGHNVSFPDSTCPGAHADPLLAALADNGGPTQTMALGDLSAAREAVPATGANCAATDQRGTARPIGDACDAGAFEAALVPPVDTGGGQQQPPVDTGGGGNTPPSTSPPDKTPPTVKLLFPKQKLAKVLKSGFNCAFSTSEPGSYTAKSGKTGSTKGAIAKAGKQKCVIKFTKKAKKKLAKAKKLVVTVVVTVKDAAGNATVKKKKLPLKR